MLSNAIVVLSTAADANYAVRISSFDDLVSASLELARQPRSPPRYGSADDAPFITPDDLSWHYDYIGIDIQVASERSLETFLNFARSGELGPEQQRAPLLRLQLRGKPYARPTSAMSNSNAFLSPIRDGSNVGAAPSPVAPVSQTVPTGRGNKSTRPGAASSQVAAEAAPQPSLAAQNSSSTNADVRSGTWAPNGSEVPNHVKAQQLLASFAIPSGPPVPVVRTIMIDGSFSAEVPFNPYLTPSMDELRTRIWSVFAPYLQKLSADVKSNVAPTVNNFLIAFREVENPVAVDIDDEKDIALAGAIGKEKGEATLLFYVDVPPYEPEDAYVSPITETTLHSPPRGLGVNQCHTPRRGKHAPRPIADEGDEEAA